MECWDTLKKEGFPLGFSAGKPSQINLVAPKIVKKKSNHHVAQMRCFDWTIYGRGIISDPASL